MYTRICGVERYDVDVARKYLNDGGTNSKETRKCSHSVIDRCTISCMKHLHAYRCRSTRHSEGLASLLTSRGRVRAETLKAQSFNQVANDPQEVPSTA